MLGTRVCNTSLWGTSIHTDRLCYVQFCSFFQRENSPPFFFFAPLQDKFQAICCAVEGVNFFCTNLQLISLFNIPPHTYFPPQLYIQGLISYQKLAVSRYHLSSPYPFFSRRFCQDSLSLHCSIFKLYSFVLVLLALVGEMI